MTARCIECPAERTCGACSQRELCPAVTLAKLGGALRPASRELTHYRSISRRRNDVLYRSLKGLAGAFRTLRQDRKPSFSQKVEQHITSLLGSGPVRIEHVARDLGCSRQTLYRRLKAEGLTFEQVLDGLRRRSALRLVRGRGLTVKEIAYRLGFSDPASFSRAFKRWTGLSPQSLRDGKGA